MTYRFNVISDRTGRASGMVSPSVMPLKAASLRRGCRKINGVYYRLVSWKSRLRSKSDYKLVFLGDIRKREGQEQRPPAHD